MSDSTRPWNVGEALVEFEQIIPAHTCQGEGCEHPGGMYLFVSDDPESVTVSSGSHRLSPHVVLQAFVKLIDTMFQDSRPEDMPAMLAWAHGREAMKQAVEIVPAPGDVSFNIEAILNDINEKYGESNG